MRSWELLAGIYSRLLDDAPEGSRTELVRKWNTGGVAGSIIHVSYNRVICCEDLVHAAAGVIDYRCGRRVSTEKVQGLGMEAVLTNTRRREGKYESPVHLSAHSDQLIVLIFNLAAGLAKWNDSDQNNLTHEGGVQPAKEY
jgi:hypothetical protein